jgi:predicted nucleic acid-binding protein
LALICDTGPLYAAMDDQERLHTTCAQLLAETMERRVVPAPVVVELEWLASSRGLSDAFDTFLSDVEDGTVIVEALTLTDYIRCRQLCRQYSDFPLGLVDAAVIAVAERLGETKIVTLDRRHFSVVRPRHVRSFTLLPHLGA